MNNLRSQKSLKSNKNSKSNHKDRLNEAVQQEYDKLELARIKLEYEKLAKEIQLSSRTKSMD